MKKLFYPIAGIVLIAASAFTVIKSQDWKISDNYTVKFSGGDPSGEFKGLKGVVSFDPADPTAGKFDVTVDVATINTGNGMKNTHAKSPMWFDAEKFPTIKFTSSSIGKSNNGQYEAKGTLVCKHVRGVTFGHLLVRYSKDDQPSCDPGSEADQDRNFGEKPPVAGKQTDDDETGKSNASANYIELLCRVHRRIFGWLS